MKGCNKMKYASRAEAKSWDRHLRARYSEVKQRPYLCPRCGAWHLSTSPKTGSRKGGRRGAGARR